MLDSNLPTFYLKEPKDAIKANSTIYLSHPNSDPEPAYSLRHWDPSSPAARNCYAIALYDCWNPDVLFGEVTVRPDWSQPNSSPETIRANGGLPVPPEPVMPTEFTIQLYNPDQQVTVTHKAGSLIGSSRWDFSMPQRSFAAPSMSKLDRSMNNPVLAETTPQVNFSWKREGKLTKELGCVVTGKSTDVTGKKRHKEPDIIIAMFKGLKEITIYEPNLYRVEMEDPKGLEVVLLLGAMAIRDVWFGNTRQAFNMVDPRNSKDSPGSLTKIPTNTSPTGSKKPSPRPIGNSSGAAIAGLYQPPSQNNSSTVQGSNAGIPPTDPGMKYEIDRETARLKAQVAKEEREMRAKQEAKRKEDEKAAEAETKRLRKIFEAEQKEQRRRQDEVARETEKLRKQYGNQAQHRPPQINLPPPGPMWAPQTVQIAQQRPHSAQGYQIPPPINYQNPSMSGGLQPPSSVDPGKRNRRRSFWDLRS